MRSVAAGSSGLEGGVQRERLLDPDPIDKRQTGPSAGGPISEDECNELGRERVEIRGGCGSKEGDELVQGSALGAGGDHAENDMDGRRGEDDVGGVFE